MHTERPGVVSASPSQLRVRVGVDATFVCRLNGQPASSQQVRWSRPIGVTPLTLQYTSVCNTITRESSVFNENGILKSVTEQVQAMVRYVGHVIRDNVSCLQKTLFKGHYREEEEEEDQGCHGWITSTHGQDLV